MGWLTGLEPATIDDRVLEMFSIESTFPSSKPATMVTNTLSAFSRLVVLAGFVASVHGAELKPYSGAGCAAPLDHFTEEVWGKVAAQSCLKCHKPGGDAEESKLVLHDPRRSQ